MKTSDSIVNIGPAFLEAQKKIGVVLKANEAKGAKFSYMYADLASVIEACQAFNDAGIFIMQPTGFLDDGQSYVETVFTHAASGEYFSERMLVPVRPGADAQTLGSGLTYARRYSILSFGFMRTEDDDGAGATNNQMSQQSGNGRSQEASEQSFKVDRPLPPVNLNSSHLSGLLSRDQLIEWIKFHGPLRSDGQAATYDDVARHVCRKHDDDTFDASTIAPIDRAKLQNFLKTLRTQR